MSATDDDKGKGVWRTVSGRRIFIKEGQSLTEAMRESGKFKKEATDTKDKKKAKPILVKVNLNDDVQKNFDKAKTANEQREIMYDHIMAKLRGKYSAPDGRVVEITSRTADKYTHLAPVEKLKVAPELARLIKSGVLENVTKAEHKQYVAFAYYKVAFSIGNRKFTGLLNIGIRKNGSSALYDLKPYEEQNKKS